MYRSASTRALLRADRLAQLRAQNPRLARALGMTDAEAAELLEFLADQEMRRADAFNKSRRNREFNGGEIVAQQKRELAERLGEDRARKYEAYRNGAPDRQQVRSFRSRLDDSAMLSDAQAQALETALQDERERYASELKAELGDRTTFAMKSQFGRALMTSNPSSDEDAQERQLLEQMETYHRRARERAATLLSPEQLEAFEEFQAAQLASERVMLRRMRDTDPAK
jgi:xanthine/CO dehydrogenase XdhC/CoxF family maturation factor